jgi:YD repeat-containing protein
MVTGKERVDGGPFTVYFKRDFDAAGRETSFVHCSTDGKYCGRTESEYDEQGRLKLQREIELPSGRTETRTEYEYPAENRRRALDFSPTIRDPDVPASLPTWIIDTTYDGAGRVIEETTSAPGTAKNEGCDHCPSPGHIARRYDDQGHLMDERDSGWGGHTIYTYNEQGDVISKHVLQAGVGETGWDFGYEYDRFGNWTSKTWYQLDSSGKRGKPLRVNHQKLTYYTQ